MDAPSIKRRYLRRDLSIPIKFVVDGEARSCLTTTLGEGGLYAQTLLPPPLAALIRVSFELPDGHPIEVTGEVRHSLEHSYGSLPAGFGIQFLDLKESDRQRIISLVDEEDGA